MPQDLARRAGVLARAGLVTRAQLRAAGIDGRTADREVAARRWQRLLPAVYLASSAPPSARQRLVAALLHAGPGAALSGAAGCRLWDLVDVPDTGPVDVVQPHRLRCRSTGFVRVRRTTGPLEVHVRDGLRVAAAERCVVDAARQLDDLRSARALVLAAVRSPWCDVEGVAAVLEATGSAGSALCRHALRDARRGAWSAPEAEAADVLLDGLPTGLGLQLNVEVRVAGRLLGTVDGWCVGTGAGWEVDSVRHHGDRETLDRTLARHAVFAAHGLALVHRSPARVRRDPVGFVAEVAAAAGATPLPARLTLTGPTPVLGLARRRTGSRPQGRGTQDSLSSPRE